MRKDVREFIRRLEAVGLKDALHAPVLSRRDPVAIVELRKLGISV